jgi:hypothetical protein
MKRFTVKDFIDYNGPCFSCDSPINFKIGFLDLEARTDASYLRPTVTNNYTEIDLRITYENSLKLYIFHKTNKILTNSNQGLTKYLSSRKLFLSSSCERCLTQIDSQYLDFNVDKGFVAATGIATERLMVMDDHNLYRINSFFMADKSSLTVDKIDKTTPLSPLRLELPLLPKYRFKDKKHFLRKIKTYVTFS